MKTKNKKLIISESQLKRLQEKGYSFTSIKKKINESNNELPIHPDLNDGSGSVQDSAEDIARILAKDNPYQPYLSKGQTKLGLIESLIKQLNFKWQDFKEDYNKNKDAD